MNRDETFAYKATHASARDGSTAMCVSYEPFILVNEDGFEWKDSRLAWNLLPDQSGQPSITCPVCGRTSYHPEDVRQGYCGHCHEFTSPR